MDMVELSMKMEIATMDSLIKDINLVLVDITGIMGIYMRGTGRSIKYTEEGHFIWLHQAKLLKLIGEMAS